MRDPTQTQTHAHAQTHAHTYTNTHSHTPIHTHTSHPHKFTREHALTRTYLHIHADANPTYRAFVPAHELRNGKSISRHMNAILRHVNESGHTWMNHRTRMKESWHTYERVMVPCLCTSAQTPQWKCYFAPPSSSPVPAYVCMRAHVWFLGYDLCENVLCLCAFVSANIIVDVRYQKYNIRYRVA